MRILRLAAALFLAGLPAGCSRSKATPQTVPISHPSGSPSGLIVTPDDSLVGKVAKVNPGGRFVVLNFPLGRMPAIEQRFSLYRRGVKVGEVKITGPQHDDHIVADLLTGDSEVGDEARKE